MKRREINDTHLLNLAGGEAGTVLNMAPRVWIKNVAAYNYPSVRMYNYVSAMRFESYC
jgi:hypothetical protein